MFESNAYNYKPSISLSCSTRKKKKTENKRTGICSNIRVKVSLWKVIFSTTVGFPGGSDAKECLAKQKLSSNLWVARSPGKENDTDSIVLPGDFHGLRSLEGYIPWVTKRVRHDEQLTHATPHTHSIQPYQLDMYRRVSRSVWAAYDFTQDIRAKPPPNTARFRVIVALDSVLE